ncbi:MAG: hypothetical protein JSW11_10945 [Candidatus Heimdallarchaeota archaeon]|nr:MAG: hypothetical protein JSW11_10945 [Candidatus Heimdallarchaeota archaeon]
MKIHKLLRKKRAVSPILAAILLIGLAVAAGAVLFIVVLPLISDPGGTLVFDETTTNLTNETAKIALKNEGTTDVSVTNITIIGPNPAVFDFVAFSINKGQGKVKDYTFDTGLAAGDYTITVTFDVGETTDQTITLDLTI